MWRKWHFHGKLHWHRRYASKSNFAVRIWLYTFFQDLIYRKNYITGNSYVDIVILIFWVNIFNVCIRFIWLNAMYIIPNFYCTTLQRDCDIGPTMFYHKWALLWRLIFVWSVVIENDFISNFTAVVNLVSIFTDTIFIYFHLLSMTYQPPIHLMFYQENNIPSKYQLACTATFLINRQWSKN